MNDVLVARASAEIRGDRVANLRLGRFRIVAKEGRQRHEHAGGAEPALQRMRVFEGGLEWIQLTGRRGKTLNGPDLMAVGLRRQHDARPCRFVVEEDGARAADAVLAADMRAGQSEILADKVAQQ